MLFLGKQPKGAIFSSLVFFLQRPFCCCFTLETSGRKQGRSLAAPLQRTQVPFAAAAAHPGPNFPLPQGGQGPPQSAGGGGGARPRPQRPPLPPQAGSFPLLPPRPRPALSPLTAGLPREGGQAAPNGSQRRALRHVPAAGPRAERNGPQPGPGGGGAARLLPPPPPRVRRIKWRALLANGSRSSAAGWVTNDHVFIETV